MTFFNGIKPIKLNLSIQEKIKIGGGTRTLEMIDRMNTINHSIHSSDLQYKFDFDKTTNLKKSGESYYLGAGTYTAVFELIEHFNNPIRTCDKLILRVFTFDHYPYNIDKYIEKYIKDIELLPNNIPFHYFYGKIVYIDNDTGKMVEKSYVIVKKYNDYTKIKSLDFPNKLLLIERMLDTIKIISDNNLCYKDLKYDNIGYDEKINFIILDYDETTIFTKEQIYLLGNFLQTTYLPFYLLDDLIKLYDSSNYSDINKLKTDKLYVIGLGLIIIEILYNKYYSFWSMPLNSKNKYDIDSLIMLESTYMDQSVAGGLPDDILSELLDSMMLNNLYEKIPSINEIICIFKEKKLLLLSANGFSKYYHKYLKYKNKYFQLKDK